MGLLAFTSNWRLPEGWGEVEEAGGVSASMASTATGGAGDGAGEVGEGVHESEELSYMRELEDATINMDVPRGAAADSREK